MGRPTPNQSVPAIGAATGAEAGPERSAAGRGRGGGGGGGRGALVPKSLAASQWDSLSSDTQNVAIAVP